MPKRQANQVEKVNKKTVNRHRQQRKRQRQPIRKISKAFKNTLQTYDQVQFPPECAWRKTLNQISGASSRLARSDRGRWYHHARNQATDLGDSSKWSTNTQANDISQETVYFETAGQYLPANQRKMPTPKANQVKGIDKKKVNRQHQGRPKKKNKAIQEALKSMDLVHTQLEHNSAVKITAVSGVRSPNVERHGEIVRKSKNLKPIGKMSLDKEDTTHIAIASPEFTKHTQRPKDFAKMPLELQEEPSLWKFWKKRRYLFSRYDEGIKLDKESWYSVTPEPIARNIAERRKYGIIMDAFCGAGGNTIQFAKTCGIRVLAIDIDPIKLEMAKHNSIIYGVKDRIEFYEEDFFRIAKLPPFLKADMVFLSPPWGGPDYVKDKPFDIETLQPRPASELIKVARKISNSVTLYLPRNSRRDQIQQLAGENDIVEIEEMMGGPTGQGKSFQAIVVYYIFCEDPVPPQT